MHWNLDNIEKKENFENLNQEIRDDLKGLIKQSQKLNSGMKESDFLELITANENLIEKVSRAACLPELMLTTNQRDSYARLMKSKIDNLILEINGETRKIDHWLKGLEVEKIKRLDDKNAKRLFKTVPDLEYALHYNRKAAAHSLNQKEEDIIDNKDTFGQQTINELRRLIETGLTYRLGKRKINKKSRKIHKGN